MFDLLPKSIFIPFDSVHYTRGSQMFGNTADHVTNIPSFTLLIDTGVTATLQHYEDS